MVDTPASTCVVERFSESDDGGEGAGHGWGCWVEHCVEQREAVKYPETVTSCQ